MIFFCRFAFSYFSDHLGNYFREQSANNVFPDKPGRDLRGGATRGRYTRPSPSRPPRSLVFVNGRRKGLREMTGGGFSDANWRDCQARLRNNDEWLKKLDLQGHERGVRGALEVKNALWEVIVLL